MGVPWAGIAQMAANLGSSFLGGEDDDDELQTFMPKTEFIDQPAPKWFAGEKPEQYAEFPEAEAARGTWWDKLQQWGKEPGYGAIGPDWGDIWDRAKSKVSQYYWGGPEGGGLAEKVKGSAARRGVSQSPALETELTKMGMKEGEQLGGMATEMATKEAAFGEAGRQNWMQQLMGLTGVRPQYYQPSGVWQSPFAVQEQAVGGASQTETQGLGDLVSNLGSAVGQWGMQKSQQNWLENLIKSMSGSGEM